MQENQGMAMENGTIIDGLPMKIVIFHSYVTYHNARPAFFVRTYRSAKRRQRRRAGTVTVAGIVRTAAGFSRLLRDLYMTDMR